MGRLIVLVLLALAAVWLVRRALRAGAERPGAPRPRAQGELVRCAQCGVYLPRAEARRAAEADYCSDEHARLGPAKR